MRAKFLFKCFHEKDYVMPTTTYIPGDVMQI